MRALFLGLLLLLAGPSYSEESRPREAEHKAETTQGQDQYGNNAKQITVPANSASPTIINIFSGKHSDEESHCSQPKDWKEWGSFSLCRSLEWLDAEKTIAIFTVILGVATWKLWRATDALVKGADEASQRQLRAYIHVGGFEWKAFKRTGAPWGPDTGWIFWIPFENFGSTPARGVQTHISWDTYLPFEGDLPPDFTFDQIGDHAPGPTLIGPKGKINSYNIGIESNILHAVWRGQLRLFVWGFVSYDDVFDETPERRTEFCFELNRVDSDPYIVPKRPDEKPTISFNFRHCGRHNCADEDCNKESDT